MNPSEFFSEIFGDLIGDGVHMTVWTPKNGTAYFQDPSEAGLHAESIKLSDDIYFGLGVTRTILGPSRRPGSLQVCGIPGLWLDIDIADKVHKKENLPESHSDAIDLIEKSLPLKPSIIVNSGHGLHAYWLFKEPLLFESEDERIQTSHLLKRFVLSFKYHAALRGWTLDSVFDLARVLRVPGTMNMKTPGATILCSVIEQNDKRYNPEDFDEFLSSASEILNDDDISELLSLEKNPLQLFLKPGAEPPYNKLEALKQIESRFEKTWNRERSDIKDQSLSTYEMSISSVCCGYGWSPQETADALIAFRRKHARTEKERLKGLRVDYITRTILKSLKGLKKEEKLTRFDSDLLELTSMAEKKGDDKEKEPAKQEKDKICDVLEKVLKVRVVKVIKYITDNPIFELILDTGEAIRIGTIDKLITQRNLKNILAAHCGTVMRCSKSEIWDEYATLLLRLVEERTPSAEDATEKGIFISMISQYLGKIPIVKDLQSAYFGGLPFEKDGKIYIFSKNFVNWTKFNAEPLTISQFAMTATMIGIKTKRLHFNKEVNGVNRDTTANVYDVTNFVDSDVSSSQDSAGVTDIAEMTMAVFQ